MVDATPVGAESPANDLFDIRREMRQLLFKLLATIGSLFLLSFGIGDLLNSDVLLGGVLILSGIVILASLYGFLRSGDDASAVQIWNCVIVCLCIALLYSGGSDNTGIYWLYPILMTGIAINTLRIGLILFGFTALLSCVALLSPVSDLFKISYGETESIRFVITLLFAGVVSLLSVFVQEKSHRNMTKLHQEVQQLASFDSLTGLANRWFFRHWLERMLSRTKNNDERMALLYVDLDDFKKVNDRFGHQVGDRLLETFGTQLVNAIRPGDSATRVNPNGLARLAGDEFAVLLTDISHPSQVAQVAERLLTLFDQGAAVDGQVLPFSASIGIAMYPEDGDSAQALLNHADAAMYKAKQSGKNRYHFFTAEIAREIEERKQIEDGLRAALDNKTFSLAYMPIMDCQSEKLVAVEVLLRTDEAQLAGIGPDRFIPIAEETGLIREIDRRVLEQALIGVKKLQQAHGFNGLCCINISSVELHNPAFPQLVADLLAQYQVDPAHIELELTETSMVLNDAESIAVLEALKALGVSLALDDFGTGYTAFNQLSSYPVDCLKIDRSFVNDLFSEQQSKQKMVPIIQSLASLYGLRVIAEGVENAEQLAYLRSNGCDWAQGYYLSKPLPWDEFVALLGRQQSQPGELSRSLPERCCYG